MTGPRALIALLLAGCLIAPALAPGATADLRVGRSVIHVDFAANLTLTQPDVIEWVRRSAFAVSNYLGRFPVPELWLAVDGGGRNAVGGGVTHGNSRIDIRLGRHARASNLDHDWMLTHEMFHLAFPSLPDRYLWMNEGLSDYLEPVARGRAGQLTPVEVWREFVEGLPQGLPAAGDRGLDNTFTRERIYWGGNLYWLLADVRIRVKTHNRHSIDDAIRAILKAGGDGAANWSLERVLKVGDKATKTSVLKDLHNELGPQPGAVDLDNLWKNLGVISNNGAITLDNTAPWATVRIAITAPR